MRSVGKGLMAACVGAVLLSGCAVGGDTAGAAGSVAADKGVTQESTEASRIIEARPLRILLTNDDGWGADGIVATRRALVEAGHTVTVVAPDSNYSGVSSAVDFSGDLDVAEPEVGVYTVSGTPATSVIYGLDEVLAEQAPDLVISGTNVGSNTGFDQNFSGTIGAAVVASGMYDIPAIAISTATAHGDEKSAAYEQTAEFLVDLLATGEVDIRSGEVLNINYPLLKGDTTAPEVRVAPAAEASAAAFGFRETGPGQWVIVPARSEVEPAADSDAALLADGFVVIDMLKVARTVDAGRHAELEGLATAVG